jgi:hypothetical protein
MSRSYRHNPVITDQAKGGARWAKRQASKAARRCSLLSGKGKRYRKCFDPWNICDWRMGLWWLNNPSSEDVRRFTAK